jgi:photosystem II oxygen-evolving enhancer protein 3
VKFSYVFLAFESNSTFILASVVGVFTHRIFLFQPSSLSSGTLFLAFLLFFAFAKKKKQSISFVAASVIALQASPALAMNAIELTDKRAENVGGLQLIYEARDLNINESTRGDGASRFALQKLSTEQTAARAKEATARLSGEVSEYVNKKYWTQAGNALRRAVYTLRFDVNNLVAEKGGDADAAKDLFKTIESLDFAIRSKDLDTASPLAAAAASKADAILAAF